MWEAVCRMKRSTVKALLSAMNLDELSFLSFTEISTFLYNECEMNTPICHVLGSVLPSAINWDRFFHLSCTWDLLFHLTFTEIGSAIYHALRSTLPSAMHMRLALPSVMHWNRLFYLPCTEMDSLFLNCTYVGYVACAAIAYSGACCNHNLLNFASNWLINFNEQ